MNNITALALIQSAMMDAVMRSQVAYSVPFSHAYEMANKWMETLIEGEAQEFAKYLETGDYGFSCDYTYSYKDSMNIIEDFHLVEVW